MAYEKTEDRFGRQVTPVVGNESEDGTGDWHVLKLDSSGRPIGKKYVPVLTPTTGTSGTAIASLAPGVAFHLLEVRFHLGSALAAAETLTVTVDAGDGAIYDVVLLSTDLGTAGVVDVVLEFGGDHYFFEADDVIVVALSANTGSDDWGCVTTHELV